MDNGELIIDDGYVPVVSYQFPLFFIINYLLSIINYEKLGLLLVACFAFATISVAQNKYCEKSGT